MSKGSLLRGASENASLASSAMRYLTDATANNRSSPPTSNNNDDTSFLVMATIVVIAIVLCYAYCMFQVIRHFFCRPRDEIHQSGSILVDQGVVFSLSPAQRRAVLEVIFSETSKAAPKKEKKKKTKRANDEDDQEQEYNLESQEDEVPASITLNSTFEYGSDEEQAVPGSPHPPVEVARPMSPDIVVHAASIPLPISPGNPLEIPRQGTAVLGVSTSETCDNIRRSFPLMFASPKTTGEDDDDYALYVPSFQPCLTLPALSGEEECKEEEVVARIPLPPNFTQGEVSSVISSNFEYYDDDETDDNVCAICLDGYEEGEVLISSKYCSHLFHKDCILEWLDKHDVCPCCRVDMVTDNEVNKAARELVGKTRMCKAVAMKRMQATPPPSPPGRARAHSGPMTPRGISPLAHRSNGPRPPPRGVSPLVYRANNIPRSPNGRVSPLAHRANGQTR